MRLDSSSSRHCRISEEWHCLRNSVRLNSVLCTADYTNSVDLILYNLFLHSKHCKWLFTSLPLITNSAQIQWGQLTIQCKDDYGSLLGSAAIWNHRAFWIMYHISSFKKYAQLFTRVMLTLGYFLRISKLWWSVLSSQLK